ncbi:MAG TPA: 50S ribosomal protein L11 methyltransferase [Candidatus Paenibacillus intestinavium]|nr:50S ribosomal protein L11 methyltransferase [Candidatus Paenibacillus intestinavium]
MKWYELTIATTEVATEMISNFLHEHGAGGVSIEESENMNKPRDTKYGEWYDRALNDIPEGVAIIKGYFTEEIDMDQLIADITPRVEELREFGIDPGNVEYSYVEVDDEDWANAWKEYFHPIKITDRITIKPTWEQYEASEDELIIELDPGMAFGTGTHPTTSLCLKTLEAVIKGGEEMIDVGTGSGVLAIGALKLGVKNVLALDLDPVAVSSAIENISLNNLSDRAEVKLSDLLGVLESKDNTDELTVKLPVDLVVANILAEIIMLFVDDVFAALKPGGTYIASGIWKNKEELVEQGLIAAGFEIADKHRDEDWLAFVARKPQVN